MLAAREAWLKTSEIVKLLAATYDNRRSVQHDDTLEHRASVFISRLYNVNYMEIFACLRIKVCKSYKLRKRKKI